MSEPQPNIVFVFADQWRAQACGYAGDPNVRTPHLDRLAAQSLNFAQATAGAPVCTPWRASFLTGQYPLTHGLFLNDAPLNPTGTPLGTAFADAGYDTAYIGKWHVNGRGRLSPIPRDRRCGFDYWKVCECTHDYPQSIYYAGDETKPRTWDGYDAIAQTDDACQYLRAREDNAKPFFLVLSWGPPHNPYDTAPEKYRALYHPAAIELRPNVPEESAHQARRELAGYYAHCTALDDCVGRLLAALEEIGQADNTVFVFTSDHGDMLGSQGERRKQRPWEESVRVPFLLRWPARFGQEGRPVVPMIDAPDIMPTLLGLAGIDIPESVEGRDYSGELSRTVALDDDVVLQCVTPFGEFVREHGGREYRGLRTSRYTYVRDLDGPWLLYDNQADPYQRRNLVADPAAAEVREQLDARLSARLAERGDEFLLGDEYVRRWGYAVDASGTIPIKE